MSDDEARLEPQADVELPQSEEEEEWTEQDYDIKEYLQDLANQLGINRACQAFGYAFGAHKQLARLYALYGVTRTTHLNGPVPTQPDIVYSESLSRRSVIKEKERKTQRAKSEDPCKEDSPVSYTFEEKISRDRQYMREVEERKKLDKLYKLALKETDVYAGVLELAEDKLRGLNPVPLPAPRLGKATATEAGVQLPSDCHADEVVSEEAMAGLAPAFNFDVFCRRLQQMVDSGLHIMFDYHTGSNIRKLYLFVLGDLVSGENHLELAKTNSGCFVDSLFDTAQVLSRAVLDYARFFEEVEVVVVPGNHPRLSKKTEFKLPQNNGDYIIGRLMQLHLQRQENVKFILPKAWTCLVNVMGHNFLLNHGSGIKSWAGIPHYGIQRYDSKITAAYASRGIWVDYHCLGHFHVLGETPRIAGHGRTLINGSFKGGDEYAFESIHTVSSPEQKLFGVSEKIGKTWSYDLRLDFGDEIESRYPQSLESPLILDLN